MRTPLIAGNWKLNGSSALCRRFADAATAMASEVDIVICPPACLLAELAGALCSSAPAARVFVGAQNVAEHASGAYTGEISAAMLNEVGSRYCIVGHSERRSLFGESDAQVLAKTQQLLAQKMVPIVCVGENLSEREAGSTLDKIDVQLGGLLAELPESAFADVVIAYEPIWAIGTGVTATPEQAQAVHAFIRGKLAEKSPFCADNCRVLYGGSVNASNAETLLSERDIDGALVGGASLDVDAFLQIVTSSRSRAE